MKKEEIGTKLVELIEDEEKLFLSEEDVKEHFPGESKQRLYAVAFEYDINLVFDWRKTIDIMQIVSFFAEEEELKLFNTGHSSTGIKRINWERYWIFFPYNHDVIKNIAAKEGVIIDFYNVNSKKTYTHLERALLKKILTMFVDIENGAEPWKGLNELHDLVFGGVK